MERQLIGSKMGIFDVEYEKKFREGFEGSFVGPIKVYLPSSDGRLRLQVIPRGRGIMMIECVGHGSPHREEMAELAIMNERLKEMAERLGGNYEVREKPKLTIIRN